MAPLTPAQKAVLERIEKKKELQQKKATKRKARAEPDADAAAAVSPSTTVNQTQKIVAAAATDTNNDNSQKRRRVEAEVNNNQPEGAEAVAGTPTRRRRKIEKAEDPCDSSADQQASDTPMKAPARRGRKTENVENVEESLADKTMNEAQLKVLQMLKEKGASKVKPRKSLKPPPSKPVATAKEDTIDIDSGSELAVTSTVPESSIRGRRKTISVDTRPSSSVTSTPNPVKVAKRGKKTANAAPVVISDQEEEEAPQPSAPGLQRDIQSDGDEGPLNATMIAVLEKIKEKKAKTPVRKQPAKSTPKSGAVVATAVVSPTKPETPLTPNQLSVMKKLQEKNSKQQVAVALESSDDEDDDEGDDEEVRLTTAEINDVFARLSVPLNNRERTFVRRMRNDGVYDAVKEGRALTREQNALVLKYRGMLDATSRQSAASSSKKYTATHNAAEEDIETDVTDEIVAIISKPAQQAVQLDSDEESDMEGIEVNPAKTHLIFDTNAYLKILPYCRAVLDSEKLRGEADYENLTMFALFVVIRELDLISKKKRHLKQPAMAAIRLIHGALQDNNLHIEGQDFASSKEKLADSTLNDDFILNSANILQTRGENVVVVTDDKNLQVKIAMMKITSLNCLEFISRFHWLTPLITADIKREAVTIGEDVLAKFTECVVASIVLKGVLAHLAPLPMERRREIFPSEKLAIVLALVLKNKTLLQAHSGPFGVLNYDRVAQTLNPLQRFDDGDRVTPKDEQRFKHFARFVASAEVLCRTIAGYFPNMESRAELVAAVASYFQMHLPENERVAVRKAEFARRVVEQPSASRSEPARKSLLPTRKAAVTSAAPTVLKPAVVKTAVAEPAAGPRLRTPRSTRTRYVEPEMEAPPEPVYFSFSQGRQTQDTFQPVAVAEPPKPFAVTPQRPLPQRPSAQKPAPASYADLYESLSEDLSATVYEYFQKFGLSICNYTGSCCVKLGVRFSLAFKVSSARLETSLPEVTDSFALVLKAMKKIISGSATVEPAREFLLHSSHVMKAVGDADPQLVNALPKITPDALLAFSRDAEGKQQLVTGYQQFCDFNNCLEKCWLEAQRS